MKTLIQQMVLWCVIISASLSASALSLDGIMYHINTEDKTASVIGSYGDKNEIVIPNKILYNDIEYIVTAIEPKAFHNKETIKSINIPNSVESVGEQAFYRCSLLKSVSLPDSLTIIERKVFYDCKSLTSIEIPNSVTSIEERAFEGCSGITSVVIPNSVTTIGEYAFSGCPLISIKMSNSIKTIGSRAFTDCLVTSFTIPDGVTEIVGFAFQGWKKLSVVEIPGSVASIGEYAFSECSSLTSISIPSSVTSIGGGAFSGCSSLTSIAIPDSITSIDNYTFSGCSSLTSISIPSSITSIGSVAFAGCSALTSIAIPNSVTIIGGSAFVNCTSLKIINIPESLIKTGSFVFEGCDSLKTINFNAINCEYVSLPSGITNLTIGNQVTKIPDNFLDGCRLKKLIIPNSVTSIGKYVFGRYSGRSIESLTIGSGVAKIDSESFTNINIAKVFWLGNTPPTNASNVRGNVNYVSNNEYKLSNQKVYPFLSSRFSVDGVLYVPVNPTERTCDVVDCEYSDEFRTISIADKVVNRGIEMTVCGINDYSFYNNDNIHNIYISHSGSIGAFAFAGCSKLREVSIPNSVYKLGKNAFDGCMELKNVELGTGISDLSIRLFQGCSSLEAIHIPYNICKIQDYVFKGCSSLKIVNFEESNIEIEGESVSFQDWTSDYRKNSSTEYNFDVKKGDVLSFNYWLDGYTDELNININGVKVVSVNGEDQLGNFIRKFDEATNVVLTVSYIKGNGSSGNSKHQGGIMDLGLNLKYTSMIKLGSNYLEPLFSDCPLDEVYIGRKLIYDKSVKYGYSPFYRNRTLRKVVINDSETNIYDNEFYGCSNLQDVKVGDGITAFGDYAFSGCTSLKSFEFGTSVETIGAEAFSDCSAMSALISHNPIPPACGDQALDDINKWECTLYVPGSALSSYSDAAQWKNFFFIKDIEDFEDSGIDDIVSEKEKYEVGRYNMNGQKVTDTYQGVVIIRYSDGSVAKKVAI